MSKKLLAAALAAAFLATGGAVKAADVTAAGDNGATTAIDASAVLGGTAADTRASVVVNGTAVTAVGTVIGDFTTPLDNELELTTNVINISDADAAVTTIAGIASNKSNLVLDMGGQTITVTTNAADKLAIGYGYAGANTFTGAVINPQNITVAGALSTNATVIGVGFASNYGTLTGSTLNVGDTEDDDSIHLADITVTAPINGKAYGFFSGNLAGGTVDINDVTINATAGTGVSATASGTGIAMGKIDGTLVANSIAVTTGASDTGVTGKAVGLDLTGIGSDGTVTITTTTAATSGAGTGFASGDAIAANVSGIVDGELTFTTTVAATSGTTTTSGNTGNAVGIRVAGVGAAAGVVTALDTVTVTSGDAAGGLNSGSAIGADATAAVAGTLDLRGVVTATSGTTATGTTGNVAGVMVSSGDVTGTLTTIGITATSGATTGAGTRTGDAVGLSIRNGSIAKDAVVTIDGAVDVDSGATNVAGTSARSGDALGVGVEKDVAGTLTFTGAVDAKSGTTGAAATTAAVAGAAWGVDIGGNITADGVVDVQSTVTATTGAAAAAKTLDAVGFNVGGNVAGALTFGNTITATAGTGVGTNPSDATGLRIRGNVAGDNAIVTTKDIVATTASGTAYGIRSGNVAADTLDLDGTVQATSTSGNAYGINAGQLAGLDVDYAITATTTTGSEAVGIKTTGAGDSIINMVDDVAVAGVNANVNGIAYGMDLGAANDTLNFDFATYDQVVTGKGVENVNFKKATTLADGSAIEDVVNVVVAKDVAVNLDTGAGAGDNAVEVLDSTKMQSFVNDGQVTVVTAGDGYQDFVNLAGTNTAASITTTATGSKFTNTKDTTYAGGIGGAGSLEFNGPANLNLDGVLSNGGDLTKKDAGTLTLTNDNTYLGKTDINGGQILLKDGGTTGAGVVNVNRGGTLGTTGTGGEIKNDLTLANGSTLRIGDDGRGNASSLDTNNKKVDFGDTAHMDISSKATSGELLSDVVDFKNITNNGNDFGSIEKLNEFLDKFSVEDINHTLTVGYSGTDAAVMGIDTTHDDPYEQYRRVLERLGATDSQDMNTEQSLEALRDAAPLNPTDIAGWSPEAQYAATVLQGIAGGKDLGNILDGNSAEVYAGTQWLNGQDLANTVEAVQDTVRSFNRAMSNRAYNIGNIGNNALMYDECGNPVMDCGGASTRLWAGYSGLWGKRDQRQFDRGYKYDAHGFNLGVDSVTSSGVGFGAAFGYSKGDFERRGSLRDDSDIDNYSFGLYANYNHASGFFTTIMGSYTYSKYKMNNQFSTFSNANLSSAMGWDRARYHSDTWSVGGALGYDIRPVQNLTITPTLGLYYYNTRTNTFNTSSRSGMRFHRDLLEMPFEVTAKYDIAVGCDSKLSLIANAGYTYNFRNKGVSINDFTLNGRERPVAGGRTVKPGRSAWNVGGGAQFTYKNFDVGVHYEYYGRNDYKSHSVNANVGFSF